MPGRSRAAAILPKLAILAILLLGLAAGGFYLLSGHSSGADTDISVIWNSQDAGLTRQDTHSIQRALVAAVASRELALPSDGSSGRPQLVMMHIQQIGRSATFSVAVREQAGGPVIGSEPIFFIGQRSRSGWGLTFPGRGKFCRLLRRLPAGFHAATDGRYFGC